MKDFIRTSALLILLCAALRAEDAQDPIDKNFDACLNSPAGANTAGQSECASKAYAAWDAELNKAYQKLIKTLDPASRELLRASQRQWLTFLESEKKFQTGPWSRQQGTLGGVSAAIADVDIVKSRVLTLRNYSGGGNPN